MKEVLDLFGNHLDSFRAIILKGSRNRPKTTDYWSDTDLLILLDGKPSLSLVEEYLAPLLPAEGRDVYDDPFSVTVRLTTALRGGITSWDITFAGTGFELKQTLSHGDYSLIYGVLPGTLPSSAPEADKDENLTFAYDDGRIDSLWFHLYEAAKKICRGDNLIGLHLILELLREYLVFDMMERDMRMGTNIHRFGGNEALPESLIPGELGIGSPGRTLEYLENLARAVDEKLIDNIPSYISRFTAFQKHLGCSRRELENCI